MASTSRKNPAKNNKNDSDENNTAPVTSNAENIPANTATDPSDLTEQSSIVLTLIDRMDKLNTELTQLKLNRNQEDTILQEPPFTSDDVITDMPPLGNNDIAKNNSVRTMFSKFVPSKISQKFVAQSIDQLESWFTINNIVNDNEKYLILKLSIEPETYQQVASVINAPPNGNKYESLKQAIIKTFTDSETKRIKSLLNDISLGDRRPSQLLSEMCSLYNGPRDKIFAELFISRLPSTVRAILISMQNSNPISEPPLETIAQWADSIIDQFDAKNTINNISAPESTVQLKEAITSLTEKINVLNSKKFYEKNKTDSNKTQVKKNNNEGNSNEKKECYFHKRFGNGKHENRNCRSYCKFFDDWVKANAQKN